MATAPLLIRFPQNNERDPLLKQMDTELIKKPSQECIFAPITKIESFSSETIDGISVIKFYVISAQNVGKVNHTSIGGCVQHLYIRSELVGHGIAGQSRMTIILPMLI